MIENKDTEIIESYYKPSELVGIVAAWLARQNEAGKVVMVQGVYLQRNNNLNWAACYDGLRDADSGEEITIKIGRELRKELSNGSLVTLGGLLNRSVNDKGMIQLMLNVTRVAKQEAAPMSEAEAQRVEVVRLKQQRGFKNVDNILETCLYKGERPRVLLMLASSSITKADFDSAINAAKADIDFEEQRVSFSKSAELCEALEAADACGLYDAIALVRGGGIANDMMSNMDVLKVVAGMKTPTIAAVGHAEERLPVKEIVDMEAATPTGLGQYFSELCERVAAAKSQSKAVLVEQVRKQFAEQITSLEKRVSEQDKAQREERAAWAAQQKNDAEAMADMKGKVKWMAGKMKEQKRKIVWLSVGMILLGLILVSVVVGRG